MIHTVKPGGTGDFAVTKRTGGMAADVLIGGSGDNTLVGGAGNDVLIGGFGSTANAINAFGQVGGDSHPRRPNEESS